MYAPASRLIGACALWGALGCQVVDFLDGLPAEQDVPIAAIGGLQRADKGSVYRDGYLHASGVQGEHSAHR